MSLSKCFLNFRYDYHRGRNFKWEDQEEEEEGERRSEDSLDEGDVLDGLDLLPGL